MRFTRFFQIVALSGLTLVLASCATTGFESDSDALTGTANQAYQAGRFDDAARIWQQEALQAEPGEAASLRVSAADAWMLGGRPGEAEKMLQWIDRADLAMPDRARLDLVLADLAIEHDRTMEAWHLLDKAEPHVPSSSLRRYQSLRAETTRLLNSPISKDMAQAARLSADMQYYDPTRVLQMIELLEPVSSGELAIRAQNPRGDRSLTGWMDLVLVIRANLVEPENVTSAISDWKRRNPAHLLTEKQALDAWLVYRQQFNPPRRIAVLLPGSGRFHAAGMAVRDGLLSAFADRPYGSELLFFETTDDPESAIAAYFSALDASADFIIGPMRKESVEAMLNLAGMSTPILALNDFPDEFESPPGLQGQLAAMSLSQEQSVTELAKLAARLDHQRAAVLAPESEWGERMVSTFEAEFLQEDRQIKISARYPESENDHSTMLERILEIDQSENRKRRLENTLQQPLEFQAMRRTDIDMIFLAATPQQARLIRPQLRFLDAGDVPVYSPGRVYSGQPNPGGNQDLNGIRFSTTPWQLEKTQAEDIPQLESIRGGSLAALFALGIDSWNVLPWLPLMRQDPDFAFTGASGTYRFQRDENLLREPAWAEFENGVPTEIQPTGTGIN